MIKKLDIRTFVCYDQIEAKINELVEKVNELEKQIDNEHIKESCICCDYWSRKEKERKEEVIKENCCNKCHDVFAERNYPSDITFTICANQNCDCHIK